MGNPTQARFDAAEDDGHVGEDFAAALGVDDGRAVGAPARLAARRVGIVAADAAFGGVVVDHRVHVARGNAKHDGGLAEGGEGLGRAPIRLGDDADPKALFLEHPSDQGGAEARVIDVGVAAYQDDVAGIPAERIHFWAGHGQHHRRPQSFGPVFAPGEQRRAQTRRGNDGPARSSRPRFHPAGLGRLFFHAWQL